MAKITRKKIMITLVLVVVIAGTNTITYLVTQRSDSDSKQPTIASVDPEKNSQTEMLNKLSEASTGVKPTPIADLHTKTSEYKGKTVTASGVVYESPQDKSIFLGELGEKPFAIELTFDNFDKKGLELSTAYTVTGTLVQDEGQPAKISVTSAKKI